MTMGYIDRGDAIRTIRTELRRRSGKAWSVTGGRGTSWGWITISAPPARRDRDGMTGEDRAELAGLLGLTRAHYQGVTVPASSVHYREDLARARGLKPAVIAEPYWD